MKPRRKSKSPSGRSSRGSAWQQQQQPSAADSSLTNLANSKRVLSEEAAADLISVLVNRGRRLRNDMIGCVLDGQTAAERENQPPPPPQSLLPGNAEFDPAGATVPGLGSETLLDDMIGQLLSNGDASAEMRAVDLIMGQSDHVTIPRSGLNEEDNNDEDRDDSLDDYSEPDDPVKDEDLVQELFFTKPTPASDVEEVDNYDVDEAQGEPAKGGSPERAAQLRRDRLEAAGRVVPNVSSPSASSFDIPSRASSNAAGPAGRRIRRRGAGSTTGKRRTKGGGSRDSSSERGGSLAGSRVSFDVPSSSDAEAAGFADVPVDAAVVGDAVKKQLPSPFDVVSADRLQTLRRVSHVQISASQLVLRKQPYIDAGSASSTTAASRPPPRPSAPRGLPPRPPGAPGSNQNIWRRKPSVYYLEYRLPSPQSAANHNSNSTRILAKKFEGRNISFQHRGKHGLVFDDATLQRWWRGNLEVRLLGRTDDQRTPPSLIGCGVLPMHYLLTGTNLQLTDDVPVYESPSGQSKAFQQQRQFPNQTEHQQRKLVGYLRVSLQLGSDSADLTPLLEQERQRVESDRAAAAAASTQPDRQQPLLAQGAGDLIDAENSTAKPYIADGQPPPPPPPAPPLPHATSAVASSASNEPVEQPTALFALLQIVEARGVAYSSISTNTTNSNNHSSATSQQLHLTGGTIATSARDHCSRNLYCAVRLFWQSDRFHTEVVWGSSDPKFRFSQISPVLYNAALLERLRQNYAIVEVWDKKTSHQRDSLVGTVKLPLHQFYLAYKDPAVAAAMLRSQYPVVGADGWLPIRDPFHEAQPGADFGQLRVLLAMGSGAQIAHLQRLRSDGNAGGGVEGVLPYHVPFDSVTTVPAAASGQARELEEMIEHCFEVCIDSLEDLRLPEDCSYGEVDCFIQYYFPALDASARPGSSPLLCLKPYRSSTTIAIPHPSFHDLTRHRLQLPSDAPFQRELVALAGAQGGLTCELWLRAYSPNLRDQCIARALLPLGRLCALVAMNGGAASSASASASTQRLALPLTGIDEAGACGATAYLSVAYRSTGVRVSKSSSDLAGGGGGVDSYPRGQTAVLGVSLLRAAGLESAARACQRAEAPAGLMAASLGHAVAGGVNAFARYWLSFDPSGQRLTRCVARSHCPDFQQHSDYAMPLHWPGGISLAELIEEGGLEIELWHQVPTPARHLTVGAGPEPLVTAPGQASLAAASSSSPEILLGRLRLPLAPLLTCKSGLRGWYPLLAPASNKSATAATADTDDCNEMDASAAQFVGAIELEIRFGSAEDRARALDSGRELGFAPQDLEDLEERWESIEAPEFRRICVQIIDAEFPLRLALRAGQDRLPISSRLYCRYRLYTRKSVQSPKYCVPPHDEHGTLAVSFNYKRVFAFRTSLALLQYLREERLEIQLWISYSSPDDGDGGSTSRDLLIGTCWLPLRNLATRRRSPARVAGRCALVKPGVRCFDGACLRLKATMTDSDEPPSEPDDSFDDEEAASAVVNADTAANDNDVDNEAGILRRQRKQQVVATRRQRLAQQHTVPLRVAIEEAKRLCPVPDTATGEERLPPSAYVTVQPADRLKPLSTEVKSATNSPAWGFVAEARFDKSLFADPDRGCLLVFKIWHSYGDAVENDRLIGTASVDLSPLLFGFKQVLGWYDVLDYRERCRGHLYIGVTPLESLAGLARHPTAAKPMSSAASTTAATTFGDAPSIAAFGSTAPAASLVTLGNADDEGATSRSMLHRSLQHRMAELDNLTSRLRRRLLNADDVDADDRGSATAVNKIGTNSNNSALDASPPPQPPSPPPPPPIQAHKKTTEKNSRNEDHNRFAGSSGNPYGLDFDIRSVLDQARKLLESPPDSEPIDKQQQQQQAAAAAAAAQASTIERSRTVVEQSGSEYDFDFHVGNNDNNEEEYDDDEDVENSRLLLVPVRPLNDISGMLAAPQVGKSPTAEQDEDDEEDEQRREPVEPGPDDDEEGGRTPVNSKTDEEDNQDVVSEIIDEQEGLDKDWSGSNKDREEYSDNEGQRTDSIVRANEYDSADDTEDGEEVEADEERAEAASLSPPPVASVPQSARSENLAARRVVDIRLSQQTVDLAAGEPPLSNSADCLLPSFFGPPSDLLSRLRHTRMLAESARHEAAADSAAAAADSTIDAAKVAEARQLVERVEQRRRNRQLLLRPNPARDVGGGVAADAASIDEAERAASTSRLARVFNSKFAH